MGRAWAAAGLIALTVSPAFAASAFAAPAPLAPGLYDGHPPRGVPAADNRLLRPAGHPRGTVMVIHGGAWFLVGPQDLAERPARFFASHGYAAEEVDYRAGWDSLVDVVAAYDRLRRELGPRAEICAYGASAGGQLAELLAASRPGLDCVISEGGVQDLRSAASQCAPAGFCGWTAGPARWAFRGRLWQFSPVRLARRITQPLLAAGSSWDPLIDQRAQLAELRAVRPAALTMLLPGGPPTTPANFIHACVTAAALTRYHRAELRLLRAAATSSLQ